jgi:hypothetical protein
MDNLGISDRAGAPPSLAPKGPSLFERGSEMWNSPRGQMARKALGGSQKKQAGPAPSTPVNFGSPSQPFVAPPQDQLAQMMQPRNGAFYGS